jgi:DNA-directed RNA polymerase subunit RPC12/RpoP
MVACANCGEETKKYVSSVSKTNVGTNDNINKFGQHYCSRACYFAAKSSGMSLPDQRGDKNPLWKNGVSAVSHVCQRCGKEFIAALANKQKFCCSDCWYDTISKEENGASLRRRPGYYSWRAHTIHKAGEICYGCGARANHAHHTLPISDYPALRANKQNGMSLCESCHLWIHGRNSGGLVVAENSYLKDIVRYNEAIL